MLKPVSITTTERKKITFPVDKFLPFLIPIIVILLWQISSSLGWLSNSILPSPVAVFQD